MILQTCKHCFPFCGFRSDCGWDEVVGILYFSRRGNMDSEGNCVVQSLVNSRVSNQTPANPTPEPRPPSGATPPWRVWEGQKASHFLFYLYTESMIMTASPLSPEPGSHKVMVGRVHRLTSHKVAYRSQTSEENELHGACRAIRRFLSKTIVNSFPVYKSNTQWENLRK